MNRPLALGFLLFCLMAGNVRSQDQADATPDLDEGLTQEQLIDKIGLKTQTGTINLPGGLAQLKLPPNLEYLDPAQTKRVVEELWGNPPGDSYLGMIVRSARDVLSADGISAIITYDDSGYISDKDAAAIDYNELLSTMQAGEKEENEARQAQGFPNVHLVGWAESPRYDAASNKLYWAKEIAFGGEPEHTLNYSIRALGRQGVLELNFVGTMEQLPQVKSLAPEVMSAVSFTAGNQYSDFNSSTDRVAGYGIAALVAGGVAAKAGFFKVLLIGLLAAKKFVVIGAIALFAIVAKLFSWRKRTA
ncbi:MAG: DUF2167 domain-containing protein [Pirellulaceae bacterium]|nr:DUF2167 domain-containing protein [Pirellulaceae bacterium]